MVRVGVPLTFIMKSRFDILGVLDHILRDTSPVSQATQAGLLSMRVDVGYNLMVRELPNVIYGLVPNHVGVRYEDIYTRRVCRVRPTSAD